MPDYRERLRNVREDMDLTQTEVGQLLNKSQQGYNHIETGRAELKIEDLVKLCKFYNLSADYIIGLVDKKKSYKKHTSPSVDVCFFSIRFPQKAPWGKGAGKIL